MRATTFLCLCGMALHAAAETTITITAGTQTGFFKTGSDIGSLNPHGELSAMPARSHALMPEELQLAQRALRADFWEKGGMARFSVGSRTC